MGALSQVYAIVWKDVYVQTIRRHYLVTAFEVALIFLSFFGVERDRPLVAPPAHCSQQPPPCLTQPVDYAERNETDFRPPQMILYTPQAGNERLVKAAFVSKEGRGVRTQGYSSEEKMLRAFYKLCPMPNSGPEQRIIALVFGSPNGANDLEFTVRYFDQAEYVARRGKAFPSFATLPNPVSQRESVAYCQIALVRAKTAEILANATREGKTGARRRQYVMTTRRMSEGPLPVDAESERWLMIVRLGIGYLVPFTVLVTRLSAEAQSGLREKLRLSGLNDAVYWLGHFLSAMFIGLVSVAFIVTYMAFVEHRDGDLSSSFLEGTDTAVVLVCMLLFSLHYITSAMVLSLFLRHAGLSALFSMAYWVSAYVVPWLALEDTRGLAAHYVRLSRATKLVTSLLPCAALHWCFRIIGCANLVGEPYSMSSVTGYVLELDNVTMLEVWVVMLAYAVTMCVAIWYLGNVLPWTRGVPRPLLFPFTASYWMPSGQGEFRMLKPAIPDGVHFEPYPLDKHEAVFVNRLGFERERNHILRNTSFKAYPEELLVVVGPSGAGKTSLVRTMTGMDVSSAGQVIVEGFDVGSQTWSARRNMGVVLQEPMLLSDMTVHEHLLFFGTVAGLLGEPLVKRVLEVEELLHLKGVADTQAADLGIPVKKRLDLAVAILPQPRVLILDEPMLRMDVTSRFIVWEVLKSVKQSSCVIMTSSNIDDVLVLADRVAILGFGGLKCYGTLAFLRQRFGCGYNLRVNKRPGFQTTPFIAALREVSQKARVLQDRRNFCNIVLGDRAEHEVVSSVLHTVELRKAKYSIASYAVSVITIEDIFVRVIFDMDASTIQDKRHAAEDKAKRELNKRLAVTGATIAEGSDNVVLIATAAVGGVTTSPGEQYESSLQIEEHVRALYYKTVGKPSTGQIFVAMLNKRRHYLIQTMAPSLAGFLVPTFFMFLVCYYEASASEKFFLHFSADRLVYDLKELHPRAEVLLSHDSTSAQLAKSFDDTVSASHHVRAVPNMTEYMNQLKRNRRAVEDALVGAQFVDDGDPSKPARAIAWYHGDAYHTQSASANLVGTALLRWASNDPEASMLSMLQPMRRQNRSIYSRSLRGYKAVAEMHTLLSTRLIRFVMLPMVTSVTAASLVLFAIDDRVSNSKAMQFTSGVPPSVYWMANYVWDILMSFIALVCVFFPVMICHTLFYMIAPVVTCIFLAYVHSIMAFVYWFSFFMDSMVAAFILVTIVSSLAGTVSTLAYQLLVIGYEPGTERLTTDSPRDPLVWVLYLLPPFSYTWALVKTAQKGPEDRLCAGSLEDVRDVCAYLHNSLENSALLLPNLRYCCAHFYASNMTEIRLLSSFSFHRDGILVEVLVMIIEGCVLLLLLVGHENGFLRRYRAPLATAEEQPARGPQVLPGQPVVRRGAVSRPSIASLGRAAKSLQKIPSSVHPAAPLQASQSTRLSVATHSGTSGKLGPPQDVINEARLVQSMALKPRNKTPLVVVGLNKEVGGVPVIRGLSFHVNPGESFAIVGLRGCGKTTLLSLLSGTLEPTSGTVVSGETSLDNVAEWQKRIGICPTHDSVLGRLTVRQTLRLYASIRGIQAADVEPLLEHISLLLNLTQSIDMKVDACSAVTRRKLAVAIAVIGLSPLVLLDDPATGLDLESKRKIYRTILLMRQLVKTAVLVVTHSVSDCVVMSDRLAVMRDGQFQFLGNTSELQERLCAGTVLLVELKLATAADVDVLKRVHLLVLQAFNTAAYNGRLGHKLEYSVTPSAPWSQLVLRVRDLRDQMAAYADDVFLTEVTLEHALLKMIKYHRPTANTPADDVVALGGAVA